MKYLIFNAILQDEANDEDAILYAGSACWGECETTLQTIGYARYVETVDGIGVYYDYGADYYFFTDEEADHGNN